GQRPASGRYVAADVAVPVEVA
ncbi:MAG: hypothetical protein AVDCRST_MAG06-985, partial [uncultured Nocardioides sp.]